MIAIAVLSDGTRPRASSLEIVEWLMPVRMANVRWLMRLSAMASRIQPPKSPSVMRLGRNRSSTSRYPHHMNQNLGSWRGQPAVEAECCRCDCLSHPRGSVSPVAQRGGTATVGTPRFVACLYEGSLDRLRPAHHPTDHTLQVTLQSRGSKPLVTDSE